MRLLQRIPDDGFSLTQYRDETAVPPYAILSHTWGAETEEVTFEDIRSGSGRMKLGYEKIKFCGAQAQQDGLQYFWVDTCCINKVNKAEHSKMIRSMFSLYNNASRCYVYLSDVSSASSPVSGTTNQQDWESAFINSRWFTRGWTLQELLAPDHVEFFSLEGVKLGDRTTLARLIYESSNVPYAALQGVALSQFSVEERLRWGENRKTKLAEDRAYSMSGIFSVDLAPVYGEGSEQAFRRLHDIIKQSERCIQDLRNTDPRDDKTRLEDSKGGLMQDAYRWVLDEANFQQWHNDPDSQLLWIKGDPGKGKTMLLCGIINELQKTANKRVVISYFFCQATDSRINTAVAVLRGLLYMITDQQPLMISHIRKKYDRAGKSLFEDANAWAALTKIFADVLHDQSLGTTYLLVDALDECVTDLAKLLDFVAKHSSASSRVKWIVSSRNWPQIEERLERAGRKVRLSLELNTKSISTAVSIFIKKKVSDLAQHKKYDEQTRNAVLQHLLSNANNTFLWVAVVYQSLESTIKYNVQKRLSSFPPGLTSLYGRMMQQICRSDHAELCKQVLASVALIYRPITLRELAAIVEQLKDQADDLESLQEVVELCGSFLTLRKDIVYFVHQSAQDFLLNIAADEIFPYGKEHVHHNLFLQSVQTLSATLCRDIYDLKEPGYSVDNVEQPDPDPLAAVRYSCVHWIDHLQDAHASSSSMHAEDLQNGGKVDTFLRKNYLYWLEGLSLCKSLPHGIMSIARLQLLIEKQGQAAQLIELVYDAFRFAMYHKVAIECSPLQTYASVLLFSPTASLTRRLFQHEAPKDIVVKPDMQESWSACLQTLEGHNGAVTSVAFSSDSTRLASGSCDRIVKIWDASSGEYLQTFEGHNHYITSVVFSSDSMWLASGSLDNTVRIWDTISGECLQTIEGHNDYITSVAFSNDSTRLASGSWDNTVKIWDASSGECLQTLEGHSHHVTSVAFSSGSTQLASGSWDNTVKIWEVSSGECLQTLEGHSNYVTSVAFSNDSMRLASGSWDKTIKIWDTSSGEHLQTYRGHGHYVTSVAFSSDSTRLASGSWDSTVKIWDLSSGECLQTLEGHSDYVASVALSNDLAQLTSGSGDKTVKIWDASSRECLQTFEGHNGSVTSVALSSDLKRLASGSLDNTVKIWDASSGRCLQTLSVSDPIHEISFNATGYYLNTNAGVLTLGESTESDIIDIVEPEHLLSISMSISIEHTWIALDGRRELWIPSEYRGACSDMCANTIGIGVASGRVWICTINRR